MSKSASGGVWGGAASPTIILRSFERGRVPSGCRARTSEMKIARGGCPSRSLLSPPFLSVGPHPHTTSSYAIILETYVLHMEGVEGLALHILSFRGANGGAAAVRTAKTSFRRGCRPLRTSPRRTAHQR